jgi:hypothetical protein
MATETEHLIIQKLLGEEKEPGTPLQKSRFIRKLIQWREFETL